MSPANNIASWLASKKTISRLISGIELEKDFSLATLKSLHHRTGEAYRIGITGPPGAGKSTITNLLSRQFLQLGKRVGIIAIDPTSPFTGGALLGDRVRMTELGLDDNIFIRSMATRGSLGGLCKKAVDTADVLDAAGYDIIIFETVGVGQSELDIVRAADSVAVILVPESGDAIQAMKAGLMEIADFFILNKSDRPGAESAYSALRTVLTIRNTVHDPWQPGIIRSVGTENKGIQDILNEITRHRNFLTSTGTLNERREINAKSRVKEIVQKLIDDDLWSSEREMQLLDSLKSISVGKLSPYSVAEQILLNYKKSFRR
ncbi:MAG: methylmalonyl Co-A mutase-associated GTPase MeaB [Ignavibacteriales bacterium]|nr:methylmalonyl Co-A mutase-associated GTPase MeaB [Ignavibacteriales bacterium]